MAVKLDRGLGLRQALALVVGTVIGSGVFFKPNVMADSLGRIDLILLLWLGGGAVSLLGCLSYAELAAMLPEAGGAYVYLREAYGRFWAFLSGWTEFWIARAAAVAALSVVAATSLVELVPGLASLEKGLAVAFIVFLAAINITGVRRGGAVQDLLTMIKASGLALMALAPFLLMAGSRQNLGSRNAEATWIQEPLSGLAVAFLAVLWAFDGWYNVTAVAEEVREPQRTLPRALVLGVTGVTLLYLLVNLGFHFVLPMDALAHTEHVAAAASRLMFGEVGAVLVTLLILCSILGTLNACILCGPRIFFAMARDGLFFRSFAQIHDRWHTPARSVLLFSGWSIVLVLGADVLGPERRLFDVLTDLVIFGTLVFSVLAVLAVIVLRVRRPDMDRPYRTWGYPWVPALYILVILWVLGSVAWSLPIPSLTGLAIIASGWPAYRLWLGKEGSGPRSKSQ